MKFLLYLFLVVSISLGAEAHEVRPALFEIARDGSKTCHISWKQPTTGEVGVRLVPHLSGGWIEGPPVRVTLTQSQRVSRWIRYDCNTSELEAQVLTVDGLDTTITDVVVRVDYGDHQTRQLIVRPGDRAVALSRRMKKSYQTPAYFSLGAQHIFEGFDHLAFVFGLVLIVGFRVRLFPAVTGFTVAHSVTLAVTALGVLRPQPGLIEALVALSILFVAMEALRAKQGKSSLTVRWPEIAALTFGLLHGFAFAGALADIGLPRDEELAALLMFNLGVEAGQLLFIAALFALNIVVRPLLRILPSWAFYAPAYTIGVAASYWLIERIAAL